MQAVFSLYRLDNAGEGKDVLGGTEDEDGLFTL